MRAASFTGPRAVTRYLLSDETQVITVRRHPVMLIPPITTALGGLLAAVALIPVVDGNSSLSLTIWSLAGFLSLWAFWAVVGWTDSYVVATSRRILLVSGTLVRNVVSIPLTTITDLTFRRPTSGRVFGYGTLDIETASDERTSVDYLPYPEQLYLEISALVFPRPNDDPGAGSTPRD